MAGYAKDHLDNEVQGTTRYWSKSGGHHPTAKPTALKQLLGYPVALAVVAPVTIDSTYTSDFNEAAQDAVGAMVANSSKVTLTYVDATPSLTADIVAGSLGPADIANRTRVWPIDVGAGFQTAGTGTKITSNGLGISYLDAETGTWRWSLPIPADLVTGQVTLYLQWATALTTGNVLWLISVGSTGAGVAHSATNMANALTSLVTVNGTTLLQTQTNFPSTNNVTAGLGDIAVAVSRIGGDASDTTAGTVVLYALWISYTADM